MKKLIISLVVAMALTGAVYGAAASLTIGGVDQLGSNTATVSSTITVDDVKWDIDNASDVVGVDVSFNTVLTAPWEVCVSVTDGVNSDTPTCNSDASVDLVASATTDFALVGSPGPIEAASVDTGDLTVTFTSSN